MFFTNQSDADTRSNNFRSAHRDGGCHTNAYTDIHANRDSYADQHAYADTHAQPDAGSDGHAYA